MAKEEATRREQEVLRELKLCRDANRPWARPMDVGGFDGSHHSRTLNRLVRKGLVERQPRNTLTNLLQGFGKDSPRASSWMYRIKEDE